MDMSRAKFTDKKNEKLILKELYENGMTGAKSRELIDQALEATSYSKKRVMHFIYNENKRRRNLPHSDISVVEKKVTRNNFQTFQKKFASEAKLCYGTKYTNRGAKECWHRIDRANFSKETSFVQVKAAKILKGNEKKIKKCVDEIKSVNLNAFYARKSKKGERKIMSSPLVHDMIWDLLEKIDEKFRKGFEAIHLTFKECNHEMAVSLLSGNISITDAKIKRSILTLSKDHKDIIQTLMDINVICGKAKSKLQKLFKIVK